MVSLNNGTALRGAQWARALIACTLLALGAWPIAAKEEPSERRVKETEKALEEAFAEIELNPRDPYLQYVALLLAQRLNTEDATISRIEKITQTNSRRAQGQERQRNVDAFSLFTGALAVQESLQLDAMRRSRAVEKREETVAVSSLNGPTIKSHPWEKMLNGRKPAVSLLSRSVPLDFYLIEFRSVNKLIDAMEIGDLWGTHLLGQAAGEASSNLVGERLKRQLAIETNPLLRPLYDAMVEEVAVTGSDLYIREGSDVTLLFKVRQPPIFKARMDGFLANARQLAGAKSVTGTVGAIEYEHVSTPDRSVHVFSAYPAPDLHVRSNSLEALTRVLAAIRGKDEKDHDVKRLGDSDEFAFIRTLMPCGAPEEDGFVYLSDPFIRRVVGPEVKLTELHRLRCYNHLRMIGHAALRYRMQEGKVPEQLTDLEKAQCTPGNFNAGALTCPDGGRYSLSPDRATGTCTCHGNARFLVPCLDAPVATVPKHEAAEYKQFLEEYAQYWRTFFDPIALRFQVTPQRYRMETIVLPLMDNSIYTSLAGMMQGPAAELDQLPVPKRNIFSFSVSLGREAFQGQFKPLMRDLTGGFSSLGVGEQTFQDLLEKGLEKRIGLHIYDAPPVFDFNVPVFLGQALNSFGWRSRGDEALAMGLVVSAFNAPVYISIPVLDAKVVDAFLEESDRVLAAMARRPAQGGWFDVKSDYYTIEELPGFKVRAYSVRFGPLKLRFFAARIGQGFYLASQKCILDDLYALETSKEKAAAGADTPAVPRAHAMVRVRAENWNQVLAQYRLGWAENQREACLNNLSPLGNVGKAWRAANAEVRTQADSPAEREKQGAQTQTITAWVYATHFFCPEGGAYLLAPDGCMSCSIHGSVREPRQPTAPAPGGAANSLTSTLKGITAALTFQEDGLHAVVTIERK